MARDLLEAGRHLVADEPDGAADEERQARHARDAAGVEPLGDDGERVGAPGRVRVAGPSTTSAMPVARGHRVAAPTPRKL